MKINTKDLARIAIVASLYVAASLAIAPLSFGAVQFRFAEVLVLFVIYNRKYSISLILGCFLVNIFSPLGIVDMFVGTLATALTCFAMMPIKNLYIASIIPTVFCLIIGAELYFVTGVPFWLTSLTVMVGEFVVVSILGCMLMNLLIHNKRLVLLLGFNRNLPKRTLNTPPPFDGVQKGDNHGDTDNKTTIDNDGDTDNKTVANNDGGSGAKTVANNHGDTDNKTTIDNDGDTDNKTTIDNDGDTDNKTVANNDGGSGAKTVANNHGDTDNKTAIANDESKGNK